MVNPDPSLDTNELRREIHGEHVASELRCDYCGAAIDSDGTVQYDILRLTDMQVVEQLPGVPSGWVPDALRCGVCERDSLDPTTDGVDEALVEVRLANSSDVFSIDATSITVVDYSPGDDGYYPPVVNLSLLLSERDLGLVRWMRVQHLLESTNDQRIVQDTIRNWIERSPDVPPSLSQ